MKTTDYLALEGVSQSMLKAFARNRQLYHETYVAKTREPSPPNDGQIFGKKCEAFLRAEDDARHVVIIPDDVLGKGGRRGTSAYKDWEAEQLAINPDAVLLKQSEWDDLYGALVDVKRNVLAHESAAKLLLHEAGRWHTAMQWDCPLTGMLRKAEMDRDFQEHRIIADLKTSTSCDELHFAKECEKWGYHVQAATYLEGAQKLFGGEWQFHFVVVGSKPPYDVATYRLTPDWIEDGIAFNELWIARLKFAMDRDDWQKPTHGKLVTLQRPAYAARNEADREYFEEAA